MLYKVKSLPSKKSLKEMREIIAKYFSNTKNWDSVISRLFSKNNIVNNDILEPRWPREKLLRSFKRGNRCIVCKMLYYIEYKEPGRFYYLEKPVKLQDLRVRAEERILGINIGNWRREFVFEFDDNNRPFVKKITPWGEYLIGAFGWMYKFHVNYISCQKAKKYALDNGLTEGQMNRANKKYYLQPGD